MKIISLIILFFFIISGSVLYRWNNYKNYWHNSIVKKNIINWYGSSVVNLFIINNEYQIELLDILNYSLINVDDWNIQKIFIDYNLDNLKLLKNNNSIIYIIETKIPVDKIFQYLQEKNIIINSPFIIFNSMNNTAIIHNYFFNKSLKTNDYIMVPLINLNKILLQKITIQEYINIHYNNYENFLFFGNKNINDFSILLEQYQNYKKNNTN